MRAKPTSATKALPTVDKSRTLELGCKDGESVDRATARMLALGTVPNAATVIAFSQTQFTDLSLTDLALALREQGEAVNRGDMNAAERMLTGQAVALNAVFAELARRAALNMGTHLEAADKYLRLALKAQAQSRATIETLAAIKNPPVVFARQANINNGGQQQVNNGAVSEPVRAGASAHAENSDSTQNELLEANNGEGLDTGAQGAAGRGHQGLAPVGSFNGPKD